ncbi:MAG TPA: hypothetical protein VHW25_14865 [Steroidobacteraceae bacterium]|jgi:hypothetical protein|nr:hypothetical protein [Steroidobacteraceae bacterium]
MGKQTGYAPRTAPTPLWERQSWLGAATLESVVEVNELALVLLREQCRLAIQPSLIRAVGDLVLSLDAKSLRCAAGSAVLLVDAQFADARAWSEAIVGAVNDQAPAGPAFFTVDGTVALMRLVMTHAWHLARSEPAAARLLLGLSAANLAVIGGCSLSRLTQLAETRTQWLRPRWEARPKVWCNLLRTARAGDSGAVARSRVRGLQLLAADARPG